jgi:hypothetical protein
MYGRCPNCNSYQTTGPCGCTWEEQLAAAEIRERELRRSGAKKVIVDCFKGPVRPPRRPRHTMSVSK